MAAGWTNVTYNGVKIQNCLTKRFEQEVVTTDDGSDDLFHRFTVHVSGIITGDTQGTVPTNVTGDVFDNTGEPAGTYKAFRGLLSETRQNFDMRVGVTNSFAGVSVLNARPFTVGQKPGEIDLDVNNGPRCRMIDIVHIAANQVFRVDAVFEVCLPACGYGAESPSRSGVLSNKWTVVDEVDHNLNTTRSYSGVLRLASAYINAGDLRGFVVPLLQPGLKREKMTFEVSRDGLTLGWTCTDTEVIYSAPKPASNWNFRYEESTSNGIEMNAVVTMWMEGPRTTSRLDLVRLCAAFAFNRIVAGRGKANADNAAGVIFNFLSVAEESGSNSSNRVSLEARARYAVLAPAGVGPGAGAAGGGAAAGAAAAGVAGAVGVLKGFEGGIGRHVKESDFGQNAAGYDPNQSLGGRTSEELLYQGAINRYGAFVSYLQCACCDAHAIGAFVPQASTVAVNNEGQTYPVSFTEVEEITNPLAPWLNEEQGSAQYTYWVMESTYDVRTGRYAFPVANSSDSSSGSLASSGGASSPTSQRDTVKVVRLHNDVCTRTVRVSGERVGKRPEIKIPSTVETSDGIRLTLLRKTVKPATSTRTADGQELFRVDAELDFVLSRAPEDGAEMEIGFNPWDTVGTQKAVLIVSDTSSTGGLPPGQS